MGIWGDLVSGRHDSHPSIVERYTDATRNVLVYARQEALNRGESAISVGDLLAGLSVDENTRAERIGSLKANAFYLRWLVGLPALPARIAEVAESSQANLELDEDAKRALAFAVLEADRDRDYWIDSDHLLRGLLRFPNKADFALLKTEMSLKSMRVASRVDREKHVPETNPSIEVVKYLLRKWTALLVPPVLSLACYLYILLQGIGLVASPVVR
jgi:ATP-dependent Clp protease ATP-binding subunit ClpA